MRPLDEKNFGDFMLQGMDAEHDIVVVRDRKTHMGWKICTPFGPSYTWQHRKVKWGQFLHEVLLARKIAPLFWLILRTVDPRRNKAWRPDCQEALKPREE
jgi:hypothetical protein